MEKLAELAKIDMSDAEKEAILRDMDGILDYVKVIEGVKVDDVKPVHNIFNIWREDLPAQAGEVKSDTFSRNLVIEQFPESQDGFLKVKKIL